MQRVILMKWWRRSSSNHKNHQSLIVPHNQFVKIVVPTPRDFNIRLNPCAEGAGQQCLCRLHARLVIICRNPQPPNWRWPQEGVHARGAQERNGGKAGNLNDGKRGLDTLAHREITADRLDGCQPYAAVPQLAQRELARFSRRLLKAGCSGAALKKCDMHSRGDQNAVWPLTIFG